MSTQTITVELPESLYRSARQIAEVTKRPIEAIVQESLTHTLPPLDDVGPDEAKILAQLSSLDDMALWREANKMLAVAQQTELTTLLDRQSAGELTESEAAQLQRLMDEYGRLLVHKAHAWLLLARRGYKVPVQTQ
ncbi:MAG: hypothetical protein H6658_00040 [Ardenticatenaceae bacterium]|nr:hypothetical protein [Ardenticatenaceae bacterium]